ncbi:GNAT family N-acetyltransferase [Enterobacteriaceae bacterium H16N7]|nr:GNAT family N-acetyltransferase [Dryocola clanedunensis]
MDICFTNITPLTLGFAELRTQSISSGFNMLRRLDENWHSCQNRFDRPGEKLLGAWVEGLLVGVCGLNIDPYSSIPGSGRLRHLYVDTAWRNKQVGSLLLTETLKGSCRWFDFINTNAPPPAYSFYEQAGFVAVSDIDRVTHRLCLSGTP